MTENKRSAILFRPTEKGFEWIEELRRKHDVHRTDVVKQALTIAAMHQPELEKRLAAMKGF